jgi:diguanylate cyclase (GGDEF)-like protein/PAS domain S-box-containing protein
MNGTNGQTEGQDEALYQVTAAAEDYFRRTPAMVHSVTEDGRFRFVSDLWLKKLGYSLDEVVGFRAIDFLTPASREFATRMLHQIFRDGHSENVEYQIICKTGEIMDVLISSVVDRNAVGGPASLSIVTDITAQKTAERKLIESEARYRSIVEDQTELVGVANPECVLVFVNKAYARHQGMEPADMIGRSMFDFVPVHARAQLHEQMQRTMAVTHVLETENELTLSDGRLRWFAWSNRAIRDEAGNVMTIHFVGRDIDERKHAEQRLGESEARYRLLADHSTDMVFQFDPNLVRRYVSPACREILGYEPEELIGQKALLATHPDEAENIRSGFLDIASGRSERGSFTHRIRHKTGRWLWVEAAVRATSDPATGAPTGLIGALRDITAKKEVEERLAEANRRLEILATQDGLTQIYNRRTFDEMLAREIRIARREGTILSLLMIDVDIFKSYNDCYGHPVGDAALRQVSTAIRSAIKRPGDMAARYGGEEFVVLLPNTPVDGARKVAELICRQVQDLDIEHSASPWKKLTVSVGVASTNTAMEDGLHNEALVMRADQALYKAKRSGRNTVVFWSDDLASHDQK